MKVCAIYLAAGQSSRMGENKLSLPLGQMTVGSAALHKALQSELDHIIVVARREDDLVWMDHSFFQISFQNKWTLVRCHSAALGQAHSLKCGLHAALKRNPDATMVILADQPFLTIETINKVIHWGKKLKKEGEEMTYIASSFQGICRPPILFSRQAIPYLFKLNGDEGARRMFQNDSIRGVQVDLKDENLFFDVDTKEDYTRAVELNKGL